MNDEVLLDYIRWRGDLTFDAVPFNDLDSAVLCELSYVDFSNVLELLNLRGTRLKIAYHKILQKNCYRLLTATGGQQDFVAAAAASNRFGNLPITFYTDVYHSEKIQFSAMHFELNNTTSYIAFRGTDDSIIGWKEDFMMTFTRIPSQDLAADYLRSTMTRSRDYYIGGHSKGGNLAVYAASQLSDEMKRHVLRVYAFDAPGFCPDIYDLSVISSMDHKLTCIAPHYRLIGSLFSRDVQDNRIVGSTQKSILQHDLVSWKVNGPSFNYETMPDQKSVAFSDALCAFIKEVSKDERKKIVNDLFDFLTSGGAERLDQLFESNVMLEALKNLSSKGRAKEKKLFKVPNPMKQWNDFLADLRRNPEEPASIIPESALRK